MRSNSGSSGKRVNQSCSPPVLIEQGFAGGCAEGGIAQGGMATSAEDKSVGRSVNG